ncbi:MAG: hypothetical protein GX905_08745 [Bacteroidales bacterium]|nr:hypothetical protein [Bacteroidales bacterium]
MIVNINTNKLKLMLDDYKTKSGNMENYVFWIGAGIDCVPPTNLPLSNELVRQILNFTCSDYADKILEVLNDATVEINRFIASDYDAENMSDATQQIRTNQFSTIPRLETLIELLLRCEQHMIPKIKSEESFISLITSFREAPPNKNHYILADAILKGATIITVNYTLLIQEAFQQIAKQSYVLEEQQEYSETDLVRLFLCKSKNGHESTGGKLYHIHGALSGGNLGNSLTHVKKPFTSNFSQDLTKLLEGDNIFLFLGYSGSDSFDVNRFFLDYARKKKSKRSTGIYVSHGDLEIKPNKEVVVSDKQLILLNAFKKKYILQAELTDIFRDIKYVPRNQKDFNWKDRIPKIGYPRKMQKLLAIDLCAFLGINIEKIINTQDWLPKYEEKKNYTDWFKFHPCLLMAKLQQNDKLIIRYGKFITEYEKNNIHKHNFANRYNEQLYIEHLDSVIPNALNQLTDSIFNIDFSKIYHIIQDAQENSLIGWEISARLHQIVKRLIYKYLECSSEDEFSNFFAQHESLANSLIDPLELIKNRGYKYVIEMNQYHLSLRDLSVLSALFKNDYQTSKELLRLSSYYYCEVSSMDGWIGNLLTRIFIITHKLRQKKEQYLQDEIMYLESGFNIINSVLGFERHAIFAKKIENFRKGFIFS